MSLLTECFNAALGHLPRGVVALLVLPAACLGQGVLVGNSPFSPSGAGAAAAAAHPEDFELAGSTVEGTSVTVCIFERQAKHSLWIPVGGDADGVHVVSYDAATDSAVVLVSGGRKELSMRKSVVAAMSPALARPGGRATSPDSGVAPLVSPSSTPVSPAVAAQQQNEARMLVSDLLEIGVQQRKAYQDAKRKAPSPPPDN